MPTNGNGPTLGLPLQPAEFFEGVPVVDHVASQSLQLLPTNATTPLGMPHFPASAPGFEPLPHQLGAAGCVPFHQSYSAEDGGRCLAPPVTAFEPLDHLGFPARPSAVVVDAGVPVDRHPPAATNPPLNALGSPQLPGQNELRPQGQGSVSRKRPFDHMPTQTEIRPAKRAVEIRSKPCPAQASPTDTAPRITPNPPPTFGVKESGIPAGRLATFSAAGSRCRLFAQSADSGAEILPKLPGSPQRGEFSFDTMKLKMVLLG